MQLLIYITNKSEHVSAILRRLLDLKVGATVVNSEGLVHAIAESSVEPPPIIGSLRRLMNPMNEQGKMMFAAIQDERVTEVINIIHDVAGDLQHANAGIIFTVPISYSETVKEG